MMCIYSTINCNCSLLQNNKLAARINLTLCNKLTHNCRFKSCQNTMKKDIGWAKNHLTILASLLLGILEMPEKGDNDIKTPCHLLLDMVFFSTAFLLKHILKYQLGLSEPPTFCPSKIRLRSVAPQRKRWHGRSLEPGALVEVFNHLRFFRTQFEVGYLLVGEAIIFDQKTYTRSAIPLATPTMKGIPL